MGVWKLGGALLAVALGVKLLIPLLTPELPHVLDGYCHPAFKRVADVLRTNVESGKEPGAAFAVYYKGELVVDLWAGYADIESEIPWKRDTVTLTFSATKGVAAVVVAKVVEQGRLDYKKPVSDYWPEFAQNDKGNITVEMLLSHQAGLVLLDRQVTTEDLKTDLETVEALLAAQGTQWPAGKKHGYHGVTFGLYVDRLIQKVDKNGRDTATVFRDEIGEPFDIDFFMSIPKPQFYRAARLYPRPKWRLLLDSFSYPRYQVMLKHMLLQPQSLMARCMSALREYSMDTQKLNNPDFRDVTMSAASGTGTARGLAKLYGILANGGTDRDTGNQLLSKDLVRRLATPVVTGQDEVMQTGEIGSFGPGTIFFKNPKNEVMFGHTGFGGQVALADAKNNVGVAYLTNHLSIHGVADGPRYKDLQAATYESIQALASTEQ